MKIYATLLFTGLCSCALNAQQTREVRVENSGVIVHESAGVEGFQKPSAPEEAKPQRQISDLNLSECIDARSQILTKLEKVEDVPANAERRAAYNEVLTRVEERIKLLTNSSK